MKFFLYIFYRFKSLYRYKNSSDSWIHAFILVGAIFLIHFLTFLLFAQTIFNRDFISAIRIDNGVMDRFVLFPLLITPIYIVLFIYYRKNKVDIVSTIKNFRNESVEKRKRKGLFVVIYLTASVLLFFFSMISSALF
jgi:RsiW-degrading membrane proteinase PrsW (M82 family)